MDAKMLEHVFRNHPDSVNNKGLFKGLLYDYFPTERSEVRLLLSAYEAGIAGEIAQHRMDESFARRMTQRLSESYGLEQRKAEQAVLLWCEAYGKGILEKECSIKQHPVQEGKQSAAAGRAKKSFDYSTICWNSDHTIRIAVPDRPKKITGTRLPDILGMNSFRTPFETWCSVMRLFEEPFSENKYTRAGKIIEPKQCEYMKQYANAGIRVVSPADIYGTDYFNKTHGDFFSSTDIFGGMWDFLAQQNGRTVGVFEMKTTNIKNESFWRKTLPENNIIQAALYAWLLQTDQFFMVSSFLQDQSYADPGKYECDSSNTIINHFRLSVDYPDFEKDYIRPAREWWNNHVLTGISPEYDEIRDIRILEALGWDDD